MFLGLISLAEAEFMNELKIVKIYYCPGCRWLLRAAWYAQELLSTFESELDEVSLCPASSGRFEIFVGEISVWERKKDGGFPEIKLLKQRVRDLISPEKSLGHSDVT
ncbi:SelT/SelW/SelH family protein [Sessilibacter sp. MAH4]